MVGVQTGAVVGVGAVDGVVTCGMLNVSKKQQLLHHLKY